MTDKKEVKIEMQGAPNAPPADEDYGMKPPQYPPPAVPVQYPPAEYPSANIGSEAYPPPQYSPVPPPPAKGAVLVVQPGKRLILGPKSQFITCPVCNQAGNTKTSKQLGLIGWVFVLVLFCVCLGTLLPLCCLPCCIPSCYDTKHVCGHCGNFLGIHNRMVQDP